MLKIIKSIIRQLLALTPYQLTRNYTPSTFNAVRLGIAYYISNEPMGTILQIGAFDGISNDPVFDFIRQGKMRAILVEPVESNFRKLEKAYQGVNRVSLVQAAITHEDGEVTMYRVKESGRWLNDKWVGQIASFYRDHLLKYGVRHDEIEEVTVPAFTLHSLLTRFNMESVGFLQVDTEGFDADVVRMSLTLPVTPGFINFERSHLSAKKAICLFQELEQCGYAWIHSRYDTLAIHKRITETWHGKK